MFFNSKLLKQTKKNIIIYGYGAIGKLTLNLCQLNGINIKAVCDNSPVIQKENDIIKMPVYNFEKIKMLFPHNVVFIITAYNIKDIVSQISYESSYQWYGIDQIFDFSPLSYMETRNILSNHFISVIYNHYLYHNGDKLNLNSIDFVITEKCSLKCAECSNLMQYYKNPVNFDFEYLKDELNKLTVLYNSIRDLRVIGGEPMLYPQLIDILEYAEHLDQIKDISIWTNGTIFPNKKFFDRLQSLKKIRFQISDYGTLSKNLTPLINELECRKIFYKISRSFWTKCSTITKHNRTNEEIRDVYKNCCERNTVSIIKNIITPCPFISNGINLNLLPKNEDSFVNIDDMEVNEIQNKLRSMHEKSYYSLCDYCNGRPIRPNLSELISPCIQLKIS